MQVKRSICRSPQRMPPAADISSYLHSKQAIHDGLSNAAPLSAARQEGLWRPPTPWKG